MTGSQKAAALLIAMGRDAAVRLLRHFDPEDVKEITLAAATLGIVDGGSLDSLIAQFAAELEEGPRMMSNIIDCPQTPEALELDMKLEVAFEALDDKITLPVFRPAKG